MDNSMNNNLSGGFEALMLFGIAVIIGILIEYSLNIVFRIKIEFLYVYVSISVIILHQIYRTIRKW